MNAPLLWLLCSNPPLHCCPSVRDELSSLGERGVWMNRTLKLGKTPMHDDCIDNTMSVHMVLPDLDTSFSGSVLKVVTECVGVS